MNGLPDQRHFAGRYHEKGLPSRIRKPVATGYKGTGRKVRLNGTVADAISFSCQSDLGETRNVDRSSPDMAVKDLSRGVTPEEVIRIDPVPSNP